MEDSEEELGVLEDPENEYDIPPGGVDLVLHVVTKEEWRAKEPTGKHRLRHPLKLVVDHFTYTEPCYTYEECLKAVQDMQKEDMANGLTDIKYNFLVGGDGGIYQGRSWHVTSSKQLQQFPNLNRRKLDIAYIGDFTDQNVPEIMQKRFMEIVDFGIKFNMIKRFYNSVSVRRGVELLPKIENTANDGSEEKEPVVNKDCTEKEGGITDETNQSNTDVSKQNVEEPEQKNVGTV